MVYVKFLLLFYTFGFSLQRSYGHGTMMDPVSRSSMWRQGFPSEPNYTDNELNCGGTFTQFYLNKGKCGVCGDNYAMPRPRPNENGGIYGNSTIVKKYVKGGIVNVKIKLTANHMGNFKFDLCPLKRTNDLEDEECFNRYSLRVINGDYEVRIPNDKLIFNLRVKLSKNVVCDHCVFRWTYRAANNWGQCDDGTSDLGCGPQETFKNCADISIERY
ncbi:uncharacterized protein LOC108626699 [Ceratina calcarata]|uniref:Uncharacterized protein LOC108626699 n=1 Tax=Ceratina calcarata TaxID=156304 RepID=A0AAJ7J345_9HYME|nr:uncharacterized protein LOC108626699 [Ceratina calcarata]